MAVLIISGLISACSTQKNTAQSRWWHAFNARYNTYYNGSQSYIAGSLSKETGNKDNYTEFIPLYTVSNKSSREIGKSDFENAITKAKKAIKQHSIKQRPEWNKSRKKTEQDIEWLSRREYNPFLWKAWMLMGRSQFHMGAFDEAAATFSYMSRLYRTQPAIYGKARAWLAKCYVEQGWIYDAEDVIRNMSRDSMDWRAVKDWDYAYADYYLHTGDLQQASTYLRKVIRHEMRSRQKAREWFLLGQILAAQGRDGEAYDAFRHVVRQNPPYELKFNAQIAMTEVMPAGHYKQKISRLKSMARSDNNAEYLDQVYYAMGNVYLAERDTLSAIGAYEKGNQKATRSGIEKGVLLLHLGDLYWQLERYGDARRCYGEAIGLLDRERPDYAQLSDRSKVLDELVPHTDNIHLQDSLQALAKMSEKDRNAAIDRVIDALKKKEKEEKLKQLEAEAEKNAARGNVNGNNNNRPNTPVNNTAQSGLWYFYNPAAIQKGKQAFQQQWGKRENEDNWRRANKTAVAVGGMDDAEDAMAEALQDSLSSLPADSTSATPADTAALDPHNREYYLAQIPFTEEQLAASNEILSDALYMSGVIFKDKLDNLKLAEKAFGRLNTSFPDFARNDELFYHLFLLYARKGEKERSDLFRETLADKYPDSQWTKIVCDPFFEDNARFGVHLEDSLYAATYSAFKEGQHDVISRNVRLSSQRFLLGAHRDKFLFISGLSRLNMGDADSCVAVLQTVVEKYPQSEVAPLAGMIVKGVKSGRKLRGAQFDIANIWDYRANEQTTQNDTVAVTFSDDPQQEFIFMMTYVPDSVNENQLLYELARYNFTNFLVRNFDIEIEDFQGIHRLMVTGFSNFNEALLYARMLFQNNTLTKLAAASRNILISRDNLQLLGTYFSYNDYDKFYAEHFAPLPIPKDPLLTEPVISPELYIPEDIPVPGTISLPDIGTLKEETIGGGQEPFYDDGFYIEEPQPVRQTVRQDINSDVLDIIDDEPQLPKDVKTADTPTDNTEVKNPTDAKIPTVQTTAVQTAVKGQTAAKPTDAKKQNVPKPELKKPEVKKQETPKQDSKKPEPKKSEQKKDDEYFDFDGF